MFGCKAPTIFYAWLWLGNYNDNLLQRKCAWLNQQHELILAANMWALKRIKHSVEKSVSWADGKALNIPLGNLVLLHDHPESHNKVQDKYKVNCFSWNQSTRTQMCISSNHLMVRVLYIWLMDSSYLSITYHGEMMCHLVQPLIPNNLLP